MNRKLTIIVIGDKRRLCSYEISTSLLIMALCVIVGIIFTSAAFLMVHTYNMRETVAKTELPNDQTGSADHKPEIVAPDTNVVSLQRVAIENFQASYNPAKKQFHYNFLLKNQLENAPMSGYLFVILKSGIPGQDSWLAFPKAELNDGIPKNFKDGDPFSIRKYKNIANHISTRDIYETVLIYAFSSDGSLILKESFDIKKS
jgi:hypothetical protein